MISLPNIQIASPLGTMRNDDANPVNTASAFSSSGMSSRQLEWHLNENAALGQTELNTDALRTCAENINSQIDNLNGELLDKLDDHERDDAERLVESAGNLLKNGENAPLTTKAGTDEHAIASGLRQQLQRRPCTDFMERGRTLLDCIGSVLSNDFEVLSGNAARRAGNVIAVATRTGTIVALTTLLRQMVGFALAHNVCSLGQNASLTPRMVAGISSLLIGPGLNLAGAVRDERNGAATSTSRISRISMGLLSLGGLLIAAAYNPVEVIGHKLSVIGPQMATYTLARDLLQTLFPLHENGGINVTGTLCSAFMYGIAQVLLAQGMMTLAPQSGAEYLVSEADRMADTMADWAAASAAMTLIEPNPLHDLLRSAMNTAVEMFDELQRTALMRYFSVQREPDVVQREPPVSPESEPLNSAMTAMEMTAIKTPPTASDKISSRNIPDDPSTSEDKRSRSPASGLPGQTGNSRPRPLVPEQSNQAREGVRIGLDPPRIGAGSWPTSAQLADNMLTTCAMRTSIFESVTAIAVTVSTALHKTRLEQTDQRHILSALIGGLVMVGYPAFVGAHLTGPPSPDALTPDAEGGADPAPTGVERQGKADSTDKTMP
ncbi:hypothetical protein [Sodalis sp. dw_96]|uniref:hypothetical protein n=1 Tax=Sodalis sp. dw_96 TaxID=2719794 RepID=UPI001BD5D7BC|nr:hypothetical protein [Sodalis sp. dw_96]